MSNLKAVPNGFITPITIEDQADKLTVKDIKKKAKKSKPKKSKAPPKKAPNQKYDETIHPQMIIDFLAKGYSQRAIITELKISSSTWEDWKKRPEVKEAVAVGVRETEKFYTNLGLDLAQGKVKGNVAAWCFLTKNILGWKDNNEQKLDPTPISINFGIAKKPEATEKGEE